MAAAPHEVGARQLARMLWWSSSERLAAKSVVLLISCHAGVVLVLALQIVGRSGHANVVPVAPRGKHVEPG